MNRIAAFLLLCAAVSAAPPVAKIDGPTERHPGALTFLDASGSTADKFSWLVDTTGVTVPKDGTPDVAETIFALRAMGFEVQEPEDKSEPLWAISDDGKRVWLSSYPGVYAVTLGVSNADGVALLAWKVKVSGDVPIPVPVPVPVPIPTPVPVPTDFPVQLTAAVKAVPAARAELGKVADVYSLIADQIKSGLLDTPAKVTGFTSVLVTASVGAHGAEWANIDTTVIKPHLATLNLTTAAQFEGPWRQISAAVKAGLVDIPPPPDVVPLPVTGLHVCIVEEMDDRSMLPAQQAGIFTSSKFKGWLDQNGIKWRMFDDDVDQSRLDAVWKVALKKVADSGVKLPAIIISNGATGTIAPLPANDDAATALVEKYK